MKEKSKLHDGKLITSNKKKAELTCTVEILKEFLKDNAGLNEEQGVVSFISTTGVSTSSLAPSENITASSHSFTSFMTMKKRSNPGIGFFKLTI